MAAVSWQCPICQESSAYEGTCPEHLTPFVQVRPATPEAGGTETESIGAPTSPPGEPLASLPEERPPAPITRLALVTPWKQQLHLPDDGELEIGRSTPQLRENPTARQMLQISRRHARFYRDSSGELYVEDLRSANGTYVDGLPVAVKGSRLRAGQVLRLAQDIECRVIGLNEFGEPDDEGNS